MFRHCASVSVAVALRLLYWVISHSSWQQCGLEMTQALVNWISELSCPRLLFPLCWPLSESALAYAIIKLGMISCVASWWKSVLVGVGFREGGGGGTFISLCKLFAAKSRGTRAQNHRYHTEQRVLNVVQAKTHTHTHTGGGAAFKLAALSKPYQLSHHF